MTYEVLRNEIDEMATELRRLSELLEKGNPDEEIPRAIAVPFFHVKTELMIVSCRLAFLEKVWK